MKKRKIIPKNPAGSYHNGKTIYEGGKSFFVFASNTDKCFGCAYCVLSGVDYLQEKGASSLTFSKLEIGAVPADIDPGLREIPVSVNNAYGDPGIQWQDTLSRLEKLAISQHKGPVAVITKSRLSQEKAGQLASFGLGLVVLQSVSNLPVLIEPVSYEKRIESLANVIGSGIPALPYFRPIIPGFNDTEEVVSRTLDDVKSAGANALAYAGLMGTPEVLSNLKRRIGTEIGPPEGFKQWIPGHKIVSSSLADYIEASARQRGIQPFRKTSCGVSYALGLPADYNVHYARPDKYGCSSCVMGEKCSDAAASQNTKNVNKALEIIGATGTVITDSKYSSSCTLENVCRNSCASCSTSKGTRLHLDGTYTLGEVGIARWLTGLTVDADKIIGTNRVSFIENEKGA